MLFLAFKNTYLPIIQKLHSLDCVTTLSLLDMQFGMVKSISMINQIPILITAKLHHLGVFPDNHTYSAIQ